MIRTYTCNWYYYYSWFHIALLRCIAKFVGKLGTTVRYKVAELQDVNFGATELHIFVWKQETAT